MRNKTRLPIEQLRPLCLETPRADDSVRSTQYLSWASIFGNVKPVEIEVGFGKGGWLVEAAEARRDINFLGIEVIRALQLYAATRLAKRALTNARVACSDARFILANHVAPGSVAALHVYFPDPWWKARHKKRRVFTAEFAAAVERVLAPCGQLFIATDVEEYFGVMTALVAERPAFMEITRGMDAAPADGPMTNFERKAHESGGRVWRACFHKKPQ